MTLKKVYGSSQGPYLYPDDRLINDVDGDFTGIYHHALTTDGQLYVETAPVLNEEVVRLADLADIIDDIADIINDIDDLDDRITALETVLESFTSTGTITTGSNIILASGTYDLFLPTLANGNEKSYKIKNSGTGTITLKPNSGDSGATIDGETSHSLDATASINVFSDGTDWWIL